MAKIICDYCEFGTKDKLCYKSGMDKCQGELFVCRQNAVTGEKQCNLPVIMRCACCGNTAKFSDGVKQQILIEEEYRYIYAVTCDECGKVCDVELFD